jgi:predicted ATPase
MHDSLPPTRRFVEQRAVTAGPVFVGRENEMAVAEECLRGASVGQPSVIMCLGEAGVGKTRLAREALDSAVGRGFLVVWGTADETAGTPPHWPWQQVLRSLASRIDLVRLADDSSQARSVADR